MKNKDDELNKERWDKISEKPSQTYNHDEQKLIRNKQYEIHKIYNRFYWIWKDGSVQRKISRRKNYFHSLKQMNKRKEIIGNILLILGIVQDYIYIIKSVMKWLIEISRNRLQCRHIKCSVNLSQKTWNNIINTNMTNVMFFSIN